MLKHIRNITYHGSDIEIQTDGMLQMDGHHLKPIPICFLTAPVPFH